MDTPKKPTASIRVKLLTVTIILAGLYNGCSVNKNITNLRFPSLEKRMQILKSPKKDYIMVAAHRGDWRNHPENSLPAIQSAIDMGVDIVEIDVQKTKDGVFVLMHDQTLDRTTNTTGNVIEKTYEELRQVSLRHAHGGYSEEKIPTLKEALLLIKGKTLVDLDKAYPYIAEIIPLLRETGTIQQALFVGPGDFGDLEYPLLKNPDNLLYTPIFSENSEGYAKKIDSLEHSKANPNIYELLLGKDCTECYDLIKLVRSNDDHVWVNSMYFYLSDYHWDDRALKDPDANWGFLIEKGVTILQTDRPKTLIAYLNNIGCNKFKISG